MSIIFYHDEEQRQQATASKARQEAKQGQIFTELRPFSNFYLAEDYHQKYSLQRVGVIADELWAIYPNTADFANSTAATRLNGYLDGFGSAEQLQAEIDDLGLSPSAREVLEKKAAKMFESYKPRCN